MADSKDSNKVSSVQYPHPDHQNALVSATAPKYDISRISSTREVSKQSDKLKVAGEALEYLGFNEYTGKMFFSFFFLYCIVSTIIFGLKRTPTVGRIIGIEFVLSFFLVFFRDRFFANLQNVWAYGIMYSVFFALDVAGIVTFAVLEKYVDWDYFADDTAGLLEYMWVRPGLTLGISLLLIIILVNITLVGCKTRPI